MLPEEEFGFLSNNADVDLKALMKSWERTIQVSPGFSFLRKEMPKLLFLIAGCQPSYKRVA